jgi:hypothetical protein
MPPRASGAPGYDLRFIGAQRETVTHGKLAAALDLRPLANTAHLYAVGPIEKAALCITANLAANVSVGS